MNPSQKEPAAGWSHLDHDNRPAMVDISEKAATVRTAVAIAEVLLPGEVACRLLDGDIRSPKGPVFQTAIVAGTMGAKQTSALIPFCHPLPIEAVRIHITPGADGMVSIEATVRTTHKTGVEMEALTAASIAALTIYDMCKVFSSAIEIRSIRLLEKRGGKRDHSVAP